MLYKMHAPLVLVVLIGLFASTAYGCITCESESPRGCTGKLIIAPPFRRGNIEKTDEDGYSMFWEIRANMNRDGIRTTSITVQGTCCWEISSRHGETQELFPDQSIKPQISYIRTLKTKKCGPE